MSPSGSMASGGVPFFQQGVLSWLRPPLLVASKRDCAMHTGHCHCQQGKQNLVVMAGAKPC